MILTFFETKPAPAFSQIPKEKWTSWTWQMQQTLTTQSDFAQVFDLTSDEKAGFEQGQKLFKVAATPYYASLALSQTGDTAPIRRIMMPLQAEVEAGAQSMLDPLDENHNSPTARIIHRYSDRALFLVTDNCSVYCRFCTRKRFTGSEQGLIQTIEYDEALRYIRTHPGLREVIISGGDPLTLSNKVLRRILKDLREIPHVEIIRIGSRMPVVCPMRIDLELAQTLREFAPIYMMAHFSHPKELTREAATALSLLADHGIPLMNQMVLLNGVNNDAAIVQALNRRLLYLRVKPYYMFQCDPSEGSDHLRTTVDASEGIVRELWGHLSGLAMASFSLDIPFGAGKTTLAPNYMIKNENGVREFVGWDGKHAVYRDPIVPMLTPSDAVDYAQEWEELKSAKTLVREVGVGRALEPAAAAREREAAVAAGGADSAVEAKSL